MPTLASTSRAALAYIPEVTFGVTPGAGTVKNLRFTGESLTFDLSKTSSNEIRADRMTPGAVTVDATASGGVEFEMSYAEYEPFKAALLGSTFTVFGVNGVSAIASITFAVGTLTASVATSGASDWSTLQRGQWFRVSAPGNAANDGKFFRVHGTTAPTTTVITLDASTPGVAAGPIANCTVATARLTHGTLETSFTIERSMADVTQFIRYRGLRPSKMNWKFAAGSLSTGSFEFMGKDATRAGATALPGAPSASYTYSIQNGVRGVGQLWEGTGPVTSTFIKSLELNVDGNLRYQTALGTLGAVGIGSGDLAITGSFDAYFADGTQYDKFLADTYTQIVIGTQDTSGNGYIVSMPQVQLMSAKVNAGSKASDIMATFTYQAFPDDLNAVAALRKAIFIDRVGVAVT